MTVRAAPGSQLLPWDQPSTAEAAWLNGTSDEENQTYMKKKEAPNESKKLQSLSASEKKKN